MAKSISSIYDNIENLVPFYPNEVYCQSTGRPTKVRIELDKMGEDAMFLSRILDISCEQVLRWFRGDATNPERYECEGAMKKQLSNCEEKVRNHLIDICSRYSLPIVGASRCSQKTSSPSSEVKSDITPIKQVGTTNGQGVTHLKHEEQVEVLDEKGILPPSRDGSQYWKWYYDRWDDFVRSWFEERRGNPICTEYSSIANKYRRCVKDLNFDELPEPYYGTPEKGVKAVIINLNPGMSQTDEREDSLEREKFYSLKDTYEGKGPHVKQSLVTEFAGSCNKQYSKFVQKWSCLDPKYRHPKPDLCGVEWWQGTSQLKVGGRVEWLGRIYNKDLDVQTSPSGVKDSIHPLEVFALELCPYHSKSFNLDDENLDDETAFSFDGEKIDVLHFIVKSVLQPALNAVVENTTLPFAVAIGKPFAILLEKIGRDDKFGISAKLEKEWWDESDDVEDWQWPETRDDNTGEMRRVHRKYCLFALKDKNGRLARFLVCAAPGSNGTPSEDFSLNIEKKLILPYVENNPLTSELYESLTFKTLRWWSRNKANDQPRGEARKMRESDRDKKQLYKNLWNGFCNWCKQNAKRWYTVSLGPDHSTNSIHPSGGGNPHLFFKVANGQLYLGIYCTVSMYEEIQTRCAEEINAVYDDVDWTNGEDKKTWRSILIPINEDWRNPNEALFEKMSDAFERVGSILKRHGFNIKM